MVKIRPTRGWGTGRRPWLDTRELRRRLRPLQTLLFAALAAWVFTALAIALAQEITR